MIITYDNLISDQIERIKNAKTNNEVLDFIREINNEQGIKREN